MSTVAVIGCGPAGLFAAKAAQDLGHEVAIMSPKRESKFYGAQFLHRPIPGFCNPDADGYIRTIRVGSAAGYAQRVYGDATRLTSWSRVPTEPQPAWNLRTAYEKAWKHFEQDIAHWTLDPDDLVDFEQRFDLVVVTAPKWKFCIKGHNFSSTTIFVTRRLMTLGGEQNFIVYNGMATQAENNWYRTSKIFGHTSTEFSAPLDRAQPDVEGIDDWEVGYKIVGTDCDCHPNVVFAGRMGLWVPGVLTHHAYESVISACSERFPTTV